MENKKVLLRFETPFSLQNPNTLRMVLMVASTVVMIPVLLVVLYRNPNTMELAQRMTVFFAIWFVLGAIPCALMLFNSYARIQDEDLVVNAYGFAEKRYPRGSLQKVVKQGSRLVIYADGKAVASMPNSEAARALSQSLRIPTEGFPV